VSSAPMTDWEGTTVRCAVCGVRCAVCGVRCACVCVCVRVCACVCVCVVDALNPPFIAEAALANDLRPVHTIESSPSAEELPGHVLLTGNWLPACV
jgi:hypothetical protein